VHLFGFIIRIYHDARSPERQIILSAFYGGDFYVSTLRIVTSCILLDEYRRFGGICYFQLQDWIIRAQLALQWVWRFSLEMRLHTATPSLSCVHISNPMNVNTDAKFFSATSIALNMTTVFTSQNCNAVL